MKYDIVRTLICNNVRTASNLCHTAKSLLRSKLPPVELMKVADRYAALRREATIWNAAARISKGTEFGQPIMKVCLLSIPGHISSAALKRIEQLKVWSDKNPHEAVKICQPLWIEYDKREQERAKKKGVNCEAVCVGS